MLFEYGAKNLLERRKFVVPTIAALAATTCAVIVMYGIAGSAEEAVGLHRSDVNRVIVTKGTMQEQASSFGLEEVGAIKASPDLATLNGAPALSVEYVGSMWLDLSETHQPKVVRLRGVEPIALAVHSTVKLVSGRLPERGERAAVVGQVLLSRFSDLGEKKALRIGRYEWPVVGVMKSGDSFESEIWLDRTAIMDAFHHPNVTVAYARLADADRGPAFEQHVQSIKGLEAASEPEMARRRMAWTSMDQYVLTFKVLALLLGFGAVFASLNALHGSLESRLKELATMVAIGFTRKRVWFLTLQESLIISLCAAVIALPLATLAEGRSLTFGTLYYVVRLNGISLGVGLGVLAAIGLLGSIFAGVQIRQMPVLATLRNG